MLFNLSFGKNDANEKNDQKGIILEVCENDMILKKSSGLTSSSNSIIYSRNSESMNKEEEIKVNTLLHLNVNQNILGSRKSNFSEIKDSNIFNLNIPIMIFNMQDSLFKNHKQLWISDILSSNSNERKHFEKVKIKFNSFSNEKKLYFTSAELMFSKYFMDSINYFENNDENYKNPDDIDFSTFNFPFDLSFNTSSKLKLNNAFSQISYYYEDQEKFRKYYSKTFATINQNNGKYSSLNIFLEEITAKIFLPPNSGIFNLINQMSYFSRYFENANSNRFLIIDEISTLDKFKSRSNFIGKIVRKEKLSAQKININLEKIKFKIYKEKKNDHKNFMIILDINTILYHENMENSFDNEQNLSILSNLFIHNINLIFSIPYKTKILEDKNLIIPGLRERDFSKLYERISQEENKLLILNLGNINLKVIKKSRLEVELIIGQLVKFGYLKRKNDSFSIKNIDYSSIELLAWIGSTKMLGNNQNDMSFSSDQESNYRVKLNDADLTKFKDIASKANMEREEDFEYSLRLTLNTKENQRNPSNNDMLFPHLNRMLYEVNRLLLLRSESTLKLNLNLIHIEISDSLFNYIFYLTNYISEEISLIEKNIKQCPDVVIKINSNLLEEFVFERSTINNAGKVKLGCVRIDKEKCKFNL